MQELHHNTTQLYYRSYTRARTSESRGLLVEQRQWQKTIHWTRLQKFPKAIIIKLMYLVKEHVLGERISAARFMNNSQLICILNKDILDESFSSFYKQKSIEIKLLEFISELCHE